MLLRNSVKRAPIMSAFLQFNCLIHDETAKKAIENYVRILQEAFEQYQSEYINIIDASIIYCFLLLNVTRAKEREKEKVLNIFKNNNYYMYIISATFYVNSCIFQVVEFVNF